MTILYEGFKGTEPDIVLGVCFCAIGLLSLVSLILSVHHRESGSAIISFIGIFLAIAVILMNFTSHRYPIIRATIDDTISFKEIYKNYELIDVEGDIYTFKVKGE